MVLLDAMSSFPFAGQPGREPGIVGIFHRSVIHSGPARDQVQNEHHYHNGDGNPGDATPADVGDPHSEAGYQITAVPLSGS